MPERLTLTSVELVGFSRQQGKPGKIKFSAPINSTIQKRLEWADLPECLTGGDLEGELAATVIELIPEDTELERHTTQVDVSRLYKFESVRLELENKKGKGHRTQIRFVADFADSTGAKKLEEFMLTCGKFSLVVHYEPAPKQPGLPGTEVVATDEQRQAAMEIN